MAYHALEHVVTTASTELNSSDLAADNNVFLKGYVFSSFIIKSVLMIVGITANVTLIITVLRQERLRTSPTFIVLVSLAMADIILLTTQEIGAFITIVQENYLKIILCKIHYYILLSSVGISSNHLVLFSVIRFLTLVKPFFAIRHVTVRKVSGVCVAIWIVYLALSSFAFKTTLVDQHISGNSTIVICDLDKNTFIGDVLTVYLVVSLLTPVILVPVFHLVKLWILRKIEVQSEHSTTHQTLSSGAVYGTVFIFVFCWAPIIGLFFMRYSTRSGDFLWTMVILYSPLLINIHSTLDPFLYFFLSKDLRMSVCSWRKTSQVYRNNTSRPMNRTTKMG